jgi:hypothetical protein
MLTEDRKKRIIDELMRDGMNESSAVKTADNFDSWLDDWTSGNIMISPKQYAEYWLDTVFFPAGYGTTVFARQGMGKTNLAVLLVEASLIFHPKWVFLHTLPFVSEVYNIESMKDRLIEIRTASSMMRHIINTIRAGNIPVLCLDEWDSVFNATNVNSKQGKSWKSFVWRQRHFSVRGPLMIYHNLNSIPKEIRNGNVSGELLWIKGWEKERYISSPNIQQFMKIKKAKIPYLTHGNVGFEIDMDFSDILNKVSGSQEEVLDQIEGRLSTRINREDEDRKRREVIKELKLKCKQKGMELRKEGLTNSQIADELLALFPEATFVNPIWVKSNVPRGA